MSDLISTQESVAKIVDTAIRKILSGEQKLTKEYEQSVKDAVNLILNTARRTEQPTIRCKDCKHWDKTWTNNWSPDYHYCPKIDEVRKGDFYCRYAERRTDERFDKPPSCD